MGKTFLQVNQNLLTTVPAGNVPSSQLSQASNPGNGICLCWTIDCCSRHQQLWTHPIRRARIWHPRSACPTMWLDHDRHNLQCCRCCDHGPHRSEASLIDWGCRMLCLFDHRGCHGCAICRCRNQQSWSWCWRCSLLCFPCILQRWYVGPPLPEIELTH